MTKVTVNKGASAPTPSQELLAKAQAEVKVQDATGRTITLKKPGVLAQYRLVEALGPAAENRTYTNMVLPVIYVAAIGDDPVLQPVSKREVEALIQRLDEHGLAAVMEGINEHFTPTDPEKDKAALKN